MSVCMIGKILLVVLCSIITDPRSCGLVKINRPQTGYLTGRVTTVETSSVVPGELVSVRHAVGIGRNTPGLEFCCSLSLGTGAVSNLDIAEIRYS